MGIDQYLKVIKEGVFGRDVRQAIHDGIERVYEDATFDGNTNMEVARARGGFGTLGERLENLTFADVNKNFGKIDQTMLSSELLAQIAGTAPINHNPANRSVIESMTTFFENVRSVNLFNRENVRNGYYNTSGIWTANAGFRTPINYMIVKPSAQYTFRATIDVASHFVSWFTAGGIFIKTEALSSSTETKTSPSNAERAYFTSTARGLATYTVAEGDSATTDTNFFRYTSIKPEYLHGLGLGQSSVIEVDKIGDIKSVRDAVSSIKEEGTVKVNSGTYIDDIDAIGKTVHLVGINKNSTIIRTENSSRETPPLEATSGSVSNMTFYASWPSGMVRPSDGRTPYAAHIDYDEEANKTLVIEDCDFTSDWNAAVGIGMRVGFNLIFRRCKLHSTADGLGGVFFHDATTDSLRGESWITFEDCEITSDGRHALSIQAQGTEADVINCKFVRCNIYSKRAGKTINWSDNANSVIGATVASHLAGDNLFGTKNFRLDQGSYGNNLEYFNA